MGTMNEPHVQEPTDEGVLFRVDNDGTLKPMIAGVTIPNGMCWNANDDTMLFTDSPLRDIYAFDFAPLTGDISNKRTFFHVDEDVHPDGLALDVEGCTWHACYHGSKVIRVSPRGEKIGEIHLPTRNPTCPVFVGSELFITSAQEDDPDHHPDSAKCGGNVFRVEVGVRGVAKHPARLRAAS